MKQHNHSTSSVSPNWRSQHGMAMAEVLIAVGIMGIVAMGFARMMTNQMYAQNYSELAGSKEALKRAIMETFDCRVTTEEYAKAGSNFDLRTSKNTISGATLGSPGEHHKIQAYRANRSQLVAGPDQPSTIMGDWAVRAVLYNVISDPGFPGKWGVNFEVARFKDGFIVIGSQYDEDPSHFIVHRFNNKPMMWNGTKSSLLFAEAAVPCGGSFNPASVAPADPQCLPGSTVDNCVIEGDLGRHTPYFGMATASGAIFGDETNIVVTAPVNPGATAYRRAKSTRSGDKSLALTCSGVMNFGDDATGDPAGMPPPSAQEIKVRRDLSAVHWTGTATCPENYRVTGGGGNCGAANGGVLLSSRGYQNSTTGRDEWFLDCCIYDPYMDSSGGTVKAKQVYANCAQIK